MAELQDSPGGLINQFAVRPEVVDPPPEPPPPPAPEPEQEPETEPAAKHSRRPHLGKK